LVSLRGPTTGYVTHSIENKTTNLIVLLAHDWSPIVDKKGIWSINSPLFVDVPYGRYAKAFESATRNRKYTALLFLNLVPDLRSVGVSKVGSVPGWDYKRFGNGLLELLACMTPKCGICGIISWGTNVWDVLKDHTSARRHLVKLSPNLAPEHLLRFKYVDALFHTSRFDTRVTMGTSVAP